MAVHHLDRERLVEVLRGSPYELDFPEQTILVAAVDEGGAVPRGSDVEPDATLPAVVVGVCSDVGSPPNPPAWCDLVVTAEDELDDVIATVNTAPLASTALVQILRGSERRPVDDGLLLESAVYSTLQAGPEFRRWRAATPRRRRSGGGEPLALERSGDTLTITLTRPDVRNALDSTMRDALLEALSLAILDGSITSIELEGAGPSYSSGGDLDEFGSFRDPAIAHLTRLHASVGRLIGLLAQQVTVRLHGACFGSGIELPAFAADVRAAPDTVIALPELRLGLIPGAGGTVSLPRRVGRHRTAYLALTGRTIDAVTARSWGLVDAIDATSS